VHEVAEAAALARPLLILAALGLAEVRDWRVLGHNHAIAVVAPVHAFHRGLCLGLVLVLQVNVADHVVANVVRDHHFVDLTELSHLHKDLLVETLEVLDGVHQVLLWDVAAVSEGDRRVWVLVHMFEAEGLRQGRLVVDARARVTVPARPNLEVEGTVHLVLFRPENALQPLGHLLFQESVTECVCKECSLTQTLCLWN